MECYYCAFAIVLLLLAQPCLSYNYRWAGNETLENEEEYSFRNSSFVALDLDDYYALFYSSSNSDLTNLTNTSNVTNGDAIFGCIYVNENDPVVPASYLAYYDDPSLWTDSHSPVKANVSNAVAFIATSYLKLEEVKNDLKIQTVALKDLEWELPEVDEDDEEDEERHSLTRAAFTGTFGGDYLTRGPEFSVRIVPIVSNVIGILNSGTVLTPQTLEVILEIYNFPYRDPNSSLQLTFAVATSTVEAINESLIVDNAHRFISGDSKSKTAVYFDISNTVLYDNRSDTVQVTVTDGNLTDLNNTLLSDQILSLANHSVMVKIVTVLFAPNELNISYDPAQGIGGGPVRATISKTTNFSNLSIILGISLGAIAVLLIVALFLNYWDKSRNPRGEEGVALLHGDTK